MAVRKVKTPTITMADLMREIKLIKADVSSIHARLDNIVLKNNLVE